MASFKPEGATNGRLRSMEALHKRVGTGVLLASGCKAKAHVSRQVQTMLSWASKQEAKSCSISSAFRAPGRSCLLASMITGKALLSLSNRLSERSNIDSIFASKTAASSRFPSLRNGVWV